MDISSLLERAPKSPSPGGASSTSQGSQNGQGARSEVEAQRPALPPISSSVLQPPFTPHQQGYQSLPSRFQPSPFSQQQYTPPTVAPYHHHQQQQQQLEQSYGSMVPLTGQERRPSFSVQMAVPNGSVPGPTNKRLAPQNAHPAESPAKKKQSKWSGDEDAAIIELRGNGMKWEDISKHLPGRSAISCRLRFQNYLERRSEWDDEKKNKLARLYERFKKDMWEKIAKEMQLPWRAAEAMHWQIGEVEMASRANVPVFHLANPSAQSSSQLPPQSQVFTYPTPASITATESGNTSVSPSAASVSYQSQPAYPSTHNHTLPQMSQPVSPGSSQTRRNSASTASVAGAENRNRADSARETNKGSNGYHRDPIRQQAGKRYLSPFADRSAENESS